MWFHWFASQEPGGSPPPSPVVLTALYPITVSLQRQLLLSSTVQYISPTSFLADIDSVDIYSSSASRTLSFSTEVEALRGL